MTPRPPNCIRKIRTNQPVRLNTWETSMVLNPVTQMAEAETKKASIQAIDCPWARQAGLTRARPPQMMAAAK